MRVSLNRRLDRIREHYLPAGSLAWRIDRLSPELKQMHQSWRGQCESITARHKKQGLNSYELLLAGNDDTPPMPAALRKALWPHGAGSDTITLSMTVADAAEAYALFLEQGSTQ